VGFGYSQFVNSEYRLGDPAYVSFKVSRSLLVCVCFSLLQPSFLRPIKLAMSLE